MGTSKKRKHVKDNYCFSLYKMKMMRKANWMRATRTLLRDIIMTNTKYEDFITRALLVRRSTTHNF